MKKNVASQVIGAQMINASTGAAFTGSVTVYVTGDGGTQAVGSVGSGACTHEGNGYHTYAPAQAETNYDLVAFTFIGTGAVPVTIQVYTTFPQTGDSYARLGAPAGASIAADIATVDTVVDGIQTDLDNATDGLGAIKTQVAAIETDTQDIQTQIGTAGAGLTDLGGMSTAMKAQVNTEVDGAIETYNLHYILHTALPTSWSANITANSALDYMADDGTAVYDRTTDSLQAIADSGGGGPTAAQIADAVWDEAQADHVTAGSFGVIASEIADILVDTAEIGAAGAGLTNINLPDQTMNITGNITGNLSGTVGGIAGTIQTLDALDTAQDTQHSTTQSAISALNDPTAAAIADAVLDEALSGHVTAGTLGKAIADIETDATAILADTNELQTDWTNGGRLDLIVDGILEDTGTTLPASISGLNNLSAAQVNAEVLDVLATDTFAEPASVPAATASLKDKIGFLAALARNKLTSTATTQTLRNDADSASIGTSTHSDDGTTFTRGEWS